MIKTIIYSCIFFNKKYIHLLNLLLKSYKLFDNSSDDVDYLIICNSNFQKRIQAIFDNLNISGKIWCLDLKTKFEACCSRLKIFEYPDINLYNKILYLDCDILVTNSLNNILDFQLENKLYALEEGNTNHRYWGKEFFGDNNPNCAAFNSGVLLFNNNAIIKDLFHQIITHINEELKKHNYELLFQQNKEVNFKIIFVDQPFIVYNAFKNNLYDNQKLINIVTLNPNTLNNQTISHFTGGVGHYESKIVKMRKFMNNIMLGDKYKQKLIPKIILQTSKNKPQQYIIDIINKKCPEWKYIHFTDSQIIEYFKKNPIKEFSNIVNIFNSFTKGQHKADLFRYYFLYLNGGIFLDSDAIFEVNIDDIIKTYDSVFVKSLMKNTHLFNGFIATYPNNPIIHDALKHAYEADDTILQKSFHYLCEELWRIYNRHNLPNMKIYQEYNKPDSYGVAITLDDNGEKILSHHWKSKRVPKLNDKTIHIGCSRHNNKEIILPSTLEINNLKINNIPLNKQEIGWNDTFSTKIIDNKLVVTRIDLNSGWGQDLILEYDDHGELAENVQTALIVEPRKLDKLDKIINKILLYNGFPFHFEMFGCVLDYAKKYNLDVDIVNTRKDTNQWFSFYQKYFTFNLYKDLSVIDINCYKSVILLTDDDYSFPKELVSENIICINHFHKSRRNDIKHQLPITKFNEDIDNYCFPIWNCITQEEKLNALKENNKPIVTLIGSNSIQNPNNIKNIIKNYQDFEFIIINRNIPNNIPDFIKTYKNLSTDKLFNLLKQTSYVLYLSSNTMNSVHQKNNQAISGSFPLAISNGCHLIIPTGMMKPLNLDSIIYYDIHNPIELNKETNLDIVFNDRYLLNNVKDNLLQNSISYN